MAYTREQRDAKRESGREETGRKERVGLGVARSKLSAPTRAGYMRRWVNDTEGRLLMAENADYQFVTDTGTKIGDTDIDNVNRDLGARVSRVVDKTTGQKAYLMEIKQEFYDEDQAKKAAGVAATDQLIKKGKLDGEDHRYIPDQGKGIHIETR